MSADFFKTALLGPIAAKAFSVAGSCVDCMAARSPREAATCAGFGPGCMGMRAPQNLTRVNRRDADSPLD